MQLAVAHAVPVRSGARLSSCHALHARVAARPARLRRICSFRATEPVHGRAQTGTAAGAGRTPGQLMSRRSACRVPPRRALVVLPARAQAPAPTGGTTYTELSTRRHRGTGTGVPGAPVPTATSRAGVDHPAGPGAAGRRSAPTAWPSPPPARRRRSTALIAAGNQIATCPTSTAAATATSTTPPTTARARCRSRCTAPASSTRRWTPRPEPVGPLRRRPGSLCTPTRRTPT